MLSMLHARKRRKCFVLSFLTSVLRLCKTLFCHSVWQVYDVRCERRASEKSNKHTCSNQMGCFSHGPAPVQSKPFGWRNFFCCELCRETLKPGSVAFEAHWSMKDDRKGPRIYLRNTEKSGSGSQEGIPSQAPRGWGNWSPIQATVKHRRTNYKH